jgi:Leu/Phe-tRNA-protein transferase
MEEDSQVVLDDKRDAQEQGEESDTSDYLESGDETSEKSESETEEDESTRSQCQEEQPSISWIKKEHLLQSFVMDDIYQDTFHHYYATHDWSAELYMLLAFRGFIAVTYGEDILLPEIQRSYGLFDFQMDKFCFHHGLLNRLKKFPDEEFFLRFNTALDQVIDGIALSNPSNSWVNGRYRTLAHDLLAKRTVEIEVNSDFARFRFVSVEVWKKSSNELVAGEIGYTIGSTYTSLTGFSNREFPSMGSIQMLSLGIFLQDNGYLLWNLGHPPKSDGTMKYKADLGAKVLPRDKFLDLWIPSTTVVPSGNCNLEDVNIDVKKQILTTARLPIRK